jgi:hypothetical protein
LLAGIVPRHAEHPSPSFRAVNHTG